MRIAIISVILLSFCLAAANAEVLKFTKENFNQTILNTEYVMVMYYDPFNAVCKKFMPKYERMSGDFSNVVFGKLNGEKEVDLADEQGVDDYPSFELFVWGVPIKYFLHDSTKLLREWIQNKTQITYATIGSESEITEKDFELFFSAVQGSSIERVMSGIAKKHEDVKVHSLTSTLASILLKKYGLNGDSSNSIFARRKHDNKAYIYVGSSEDSYELEKWIVSIEYPEHSDFSSQALSWLNNDKLPISVFFHDDQTDPSWIEAFKNASSEIKGITLSVLANTAKPEVKEFAEKNGISTFPSIIFFEPDTPVKRYTCRKNLKKVTKRIVINCAHDFEARDLSRLYMSEEPVGLPDRNVNYVVGKVFGKQIFSNFDTYNLVYFYNSTTVENIEVLKQFAEKVGIVNHFMVNVYNLDKNEHKHTLHLIPGSLMMFSPDDDNIHEFKAKEFTTASLLAFIEDKTPASVFDNINKAFSSGGDL